MADIIEIGSRNGVKWAERLRTPWTLVILLPVLVAWLDQSNFIPVVSFSTEAFAGTLPFIAFAVGTIAYLKAAGAEAMIAEAFKGRESRMIVLAALFGGWHRSTPAR